MSNTITEPLNIPRDALIGRLQEVADEATSKRQAAQDAQTAARKALLDAIAKLTPDQVANLLDHYGNINGSNPSAAAEQVQEWVDKEKFVSQEIAPTFVETVVERTIRVLNLASDSTIKVQPNDEIYSYL